LKRTTDIQPQTNPFLQNQTHTPRNRQKETMVFFIVTQLLKASDDVESHINAEWEWNIMQTLPEKGDPKVDRPQPLSYFTLFLALIASLIFYWIAPMKDNTDTDTDNDTEMNKKSK
jgi:hypothetical protein